MDNESLSSWVTKVRITDVEQREKQSCKLTKGCLQTRKNEMKKWAVLTSGEVMTRQGSAVPK